MVANGLAPSPPYAIATSSIRAHAVVRASPRRLEALRRDPGIDLRPALLRHADDQSVLGLAAVLAAMRAGKLTAETCSSWGILAAPRYLGRTVLTAAIPRFVAEGAWAVSPHLVPQQSTHAVAGVISQLLAMRGPSLGIGGGPGAGVEAALASAAWLQIESIPGLWLVMTGWNQEPAPDEQGQIPADLECAAIHPYILTQQNDSGIALHLLEERLADRL